MPGLKALNTANSATGESISCVSTGNCVAGGYYDTISDGYFAYTSTQVDGIWGTATKVPGKPQLAADNDAEANSISCTSAGTCVAAGYFTDDGDQGYVYELPTVRGGVLQSVNPARILETRTGPDDKTVDGMFQGIGPRAAHSTIELTVADSGGVPPDADAAMLNVTAITPTRSAS